MILRVNYNDNDYKTLFENFFKEFKFKNYLLAVNDIEDSSEYRKVRTDMDDIYRKLFFKPNELTKAEENRFIKYVIDSLKVYIKNRTSKDTADYLTKNLHVTLRRVVGDEWHNGEVICYFINKDKYIIM